MDAPCRVAAFTQLDAATLYRLLQLRGDVFVAEQGDPYRDLDGRDLEPGALHLWIAEDDDPLAYLRILDEPDGSARIGRVVVARSHRGSGLGHTLMTAALEHVGHRRCVLAAQTHQSGFYAAFGFSAIGPPYTNSLISHTPMARPRLRPEK